MPEYQLMWVQCWNADCFSAAGPLETWGGFEVFGPRSEVKLPKSFIKVLKCSMFFWFWSSSLLFCLAFYLVWFVFPGGIFGVWFCFCNCGKIRIAYIYTNLTIFRCMTRWHQIHSCSIIHPQNSSRWFRLKLWTCLVITPTLLLAYPLL